MDNILTKGRQVGISKEGIHQKNDIDVKKLETELKKAISGDVRFDDGALGLYATDSSNYRQIPVGVVTPKTIDDVIQTIRIARKYNAPIMSRGGGTSLAGQGCNHAVIMDMSQYYNKVLEISQDEKWVSVQPGIVLDEMKEETHQKANLTFGPDPATHDHCTIGGMIGNNSCGAHSLYPQFHGYGERTSDNLHSLTLITYDGLQMEVGATSDEAYKKIQNEGGKKAVIYKQLKELAEKYADKIREKYPKIPRRVSGYNLPDLLPENGFNVARALVGSESTLVTVVEAKLMLLKKPESKSLLVLGYPDVYAAGHAVVPILKHKPSALEGLDHYLIDYNEKKGLNLRDIQLLPEGKGWLMVQFDADSKEEADARANTLMDELKSGDNPPNMKLFDDPEEEKKLWEVRESGLGATAWVPGEPMTVPGWEDTAVAPEKVGDYLKDLRKLFDKFGYTPSVYGHFGQGCIHCRIQFDLFTEEGLEKYNQFSKEITDLVVKQYGGSLSGEHGDGQSRADHLEEMYGPELMEAFREFKRIWDPEWKMNPGKIVEPYGQFSNLRISNQYNPPEPETHFHYPDDKNSFSQAMLRCVGVGKCRHADGGTMCPSYMVTREEEHSTRGRARLLYEMLQGETVKGGWKDEHVKESLDLCLACKGCKGDCPVNVDMATYKSEFLSHYYKGRLRPRTAYVFGWIYWWSRLASLMPVVANFFMHNKLTAPLVKAVAGIAPQRTMPKFAEETFKSWYGRQPKQNKGNQRVILWADTFNNNFLPQTLQAAFEVLEDAGCEVIVPKQSLCCGRPLYDFGMLDTAKKLLHQILDTLKEEIELGTPVVGLEPSCTAVFRDELINLLGNNENAKRLSKNTFTLAEFLEKKVPGYQPPKYEGKIMVHGHCHHKSLLGMDADKNLLQKTGADMHVLDSGCCGMAGYFGYEKGRHYEVGLKAGERVLLPAVRKAEGATLILSDGFSCREQIEQETERKGLHLAEFLQKAIRQNKPPQQREAPTKKSSAMMAASVIGAGVLAFVITNSILKKK